MCSSGDVFSPQSSEAVTSAIRHSEALARKRELMGPIPANLQELIDSGRDDFAIRNAYVLEVVAEPQELSPLRVQAVTCLQPPSGTKNLAVFFDKQTIVRAWNSLPPRRAQLRQIQVMARVYDFPDIVFGIPTADDASDPDASFSWPIMPIDRNLLDALLTELQFPLAWGPGRTGETVSDDEYADLLREQLSRTSEV